MEKAIIIGVNSFLGKSLVELLKDKFLITGVYHNNTDNLNQEVENIGLDKLNTLKDEYKYVFFISAYIPARHEHSNEKLYVVNIALVEKALTLFKRSKFIFASSVAVYGTMNGVIDEYSPGINVSPYGLSKLWAENLIKQHHSYSILRISSMYGPKMKPATFLPLIAIEAVKNKKITLFGDGKRTQNYINVADVASLFYLSAENSANATYLCVHEKSYSNLEIATIIKNLVGDVEISFDGEDNEPSRNYDAKETYKALGFYSKINIKEGIKEVLAWIRKEY